MRHIDNLGSQFSIFIPPDHDGLIDRECPAPECESYFKIQLCTGLRGKDLPCHCPYYGHTAGQDKFITKAQIEYAKSVVLNRVIGALLKDLKPLEFNHRPRGAFGIGLNMKVTGQPMPIRRYREKQLETEVICEQRTFLYMLYGVFGFCPDCGEHNSLQILEKNLELVLKMLDLASSVEEDLQKGMVENALEDCVSALDGFGREICRVHAKKSAEPSKAEKVSFQNLDGAKHNLNGLFNLNFSSGVTDEEWKAAVRGFQKRHLLSHTMGVIDEEYVCKSGDVQAVTGRKINVDSKEVRELVRIIGRLAHEISNAFRAMK